MRAAIYLRISADPDGTGLGVERQEEDCRNLCAREGYEVGHVFRDNDTSASVSSRKKRPQYDDMLERCRRGEFGVIVAYDTARLTRRLREFLGLIDLYDEHGVIIKTASAQSDDLSDDNGRMVAQIKASVDEAEAARTSRRAKRAKQAKKAKGLYAGGARRFGYGQPLWVEDGDGKRILSATNTEEVNEAEAGLIRQGAALMLAGKGVREVVRVWNASGMKGVRGGAFDRDRVKSILKDPGNVPKILDQETYDTIKALMTEQSQNYTRGSEPVNFLGGVATCTVCGEKMAGSQKHGTRSLKCLNHHLSIQASIAERVVTLAVVQWYAMGRKGPDDLTDPNKRTIKAVQKQRAALITERTEISEDIAGGLLDRAAMRPRLTAIKAALDPLDTELESLRQSDAHESLTEVASSQAEALLLSGLHETPINGPAPFSRALAIRERWETMSVQAKKNLLKANFEIFVYRAKDRGYGARRVRVLRQGLDLTAEDDSAREAV